MTGMRFIGALFAAGLLAATGAGPASALSPAANGGLTGGIVADSGSLPEEGDTAFVDVTVATLWTEPGLDRRIDAPSLGNPVDLDEWNENLEGTEDRRWLTGKLETQAVYGSRVQVVEVDGDWARVTVTEQSTPRDDRGYPGWVPLEQLRENGRFERLQDGNDRAVVTSRTAALTRDSAGERVLDRLSFNTELPVLAATDAGAYVSLPDGSTAWLNADDVRVLGAEEKPDAPSGDELVATAKTFEGLRYLWAGVSAYGFDCSGFTYSVYRAHGIDIPRDSSQQATVGDDVATKNLTAGDLLFFAGPGGTGSVSHVGLYIGDGRMIHAPNAASTVEVVNWRDWDSGDRFAGAKRIL